MLKHALTLHGPETPKVNLISLFQKQENHFQYRLNSRLARVTNPDFRSAEKNPFRVSQLESLKWFPSPENIEEAYDLWLRNNFRGQITGNHGAGKSTLAQKLIDKAAENKLQCLYLFANTESLKADFKSWDEQLEKASKDTIIIFDGLCHASKWRQRRLLRNHHKCLALIHNKIKNLPLICHLKPDTQLLSRLVEELAGKESEELLLNAGGVDKLFKKHRGNLRDCFFELYKIWSEC